MAKAKKPIDPVVDPDLLSTEKVDAKLAHAADKAKSRATRERCRIQAALAAKHSDEREKELNGRPDSGVVERRDERVDYPEDDGMSESNLRPDFE